jgi:STAM-binding protein
MSRPSYPPPVTTTSPTPGSGPVRYPTLMSQHQLKQGYAPSLQSMFMAPGSTASAMGTPSLLFVPDMSSSSSLYPSNALPRPSQPSQYPYGQSTPQHPHNASASSYPRYPGPAQASPVPPPPVPQRQQSQEDVPRIARPANAKARADPVMTELKNVSVPRDCLPKFLSIAALNTARNRETCGLLLGKDKGHKFAVTTLLIPKQHSTSDTCTMDEEELVMQFTEERALITLGWVSWSIQFFGSCSQCVIIRYTRILRSRVSHFPVLLCILNSFDFYRFHVVCGSTHSFWISAHVT